MVTFPLIMEGILLPVGKYKTENYIVKDLISSFY